MYVISYHTYLGLKCTVHFKGIKRTAHSRQWFIGNEMSSGYQFFNENQILVLNYYDGKSERSN